MPDSLQTLTPEAKQYYERKLLMRARQSQVAYEFGLATQAPRRNGNQISWRRFNALALATTQITSGVTPVETPMSVSEVTATLGEYGNYVGYTDTLESQGIDDVVAAASDVLGQNGGESIERVLLNLLVTGTNVVYQTGSSRIAQGTANPISLSRFQAAVLALKNANAPSYSAATMGYKVGWQKYIAFIHPNVWYDMQQNSTILNYIQYNGNAKDQLQTGYVGDLAGVSLYETTLLPVFTGQGASGANVYPTLLCAKEAFATPGYGGTGKFELMVQALGSAGASDPLSQRGTTGWKSWQSPAILNQLFMVRFESGATLG